mgnify:CR=1 FL=1
MALIYTLVKRRDMSKGALEGAQLYYAQTSVTKRLDLNTICSRIEMYCTASRGEIILVLDGLIKVMNRRRIHPLRRVRQFPHGSRQ